MTLTQTATQCGEQQPHCCFWTWKLTLKQQLHSAWSEKWQARMLQQTNEPDSVEKVFAQTAMEGTGKHCSLSKHGANLKFSQNCIHWSRRVGLLAESDNLFGTKAHALLQKQCCCFTQKTTHTLILKRHAINAVPLPKGRKGSPPSFDPSQERGWRILKAAPPNGTKDLEQRQKGKKKWNCGFLGKKTRLQWSSHWRPGSHLLSLKGTNGLVIHRTWHQTSWLAGKI